MGPTKTEQRRAGAMGLPRGRPLARILAALSAYLIACGALYLISFSWFQGAAVEAAQIEATLHQRGLRNELERFQHLPVMLAQDSFVIDAVTDAPSGGDAATDRLNRRLEGFAESAGLDAIYLMDLTGLTIAASNHRAAQTFIGQNYGFRPYFRAAVAGGVGEFFAIGATTARPGYFVAAPVHDEAGAIRGVVALKLDLRDASEAWAGAAATVFVTNADGIVTLATEPNWLYHAALDLPADRAATIRASRQFGDEPLAPLGASREGGGTLRLDGRTYLAVQVPVGRLGWVLHYLADAGAVRVKAAQTILFASVLLLIVAAVALILRAERVRRALRTSQADRRRLAAANARLEREIADRRIAERKLSTAQADLARVSRLAALGELAASVTHELGQPISAMRTYLAAEDIDGNAPPVIGRLSGIVQRMEGITKQLRFFASTAAPIMAPVDLRAVVNEAERLIAHDRRGATLTLETGPEPVIVTGDQARLEQVAINLMRNALLAVDGRAGPHVTVTIGQTAGQGTLTVEDTGPGLRGQSLDALQEPFHTTRASGEGMGLGLAISAGIVRDHNGRMTAETWGTPDEADTLPETGAEGMKRGGARFTVYLPLGRRE